MKATKLKKGGYSVRVYLGKENGKEIYKKVSALTEKEARAKARKLKAQYELSLVENTTEKSPTLYEAITSYIEARYSVLSPSTIRGYYSIRDHSFKSIMQLPLDSITPEQVQREISAEASKHTPKTVRNKLALFITVYNNYALRPKKLSLNVPQREKKRVHVPTREDIDKVLEYVRTSPYADTMELAILLGAFCGLRRGEIAALTWKDITGDKLTISKSQARTSTGSYVIKAPKSYAGYRELNIPPIIQEVLNRKKRGRGRVVPLDAEEISACFRVIMRHVDVEKFRFHDLRHFFASTLLVLGVPDLYAIKLTGHSTTSMLKTVYQHTFKSEEERYKSLINSAFST